MFTRRGENERTGTNGLCPCVGQQQRVVSAAGSSSTSEAVPYTMVIFHLVYCVASVCVSAMVGLILADLFTCKSDYGAGETVQPNGLVAESDDVSTGTNPKPEPLDDETQTGSVMR